MIKNKQNIKSTSALMDLKISGLGDTKYLKLKKAAIANMKKMGILNQPVIDNHVVNGVKMRYKINNSRIRKTLIK
jgi:hypothetical protein